MFRLIGIYAHSAHDTIEDAVSKSTSGARPATRTCKQVAEFRKEPGLDLNLEQRKKRLRPCGASQACCAESMR
jgi:hypothetical protein